LNSRKGAPHLEAVQGEGVRLKQLHAGAAWDRRQL